MSFEKATYANNTDEVVETQSFNVQFLASKHTQEDDIWCGTTGKNLAAFSLSIVSEALFICMNWSLILWFSFLWLTHQKGTSHTCQVCDCVIFHQPWWRQLNFLWTLVYLLLQFEDQCVYKYFEKDEQWWHNCLALHSLHGQSEMQVIQTLNNVQGWSRKKTAVLRKTLLEDLQFMLKHYLWFSLMLILIPRD